MLYLLPEDQKRKVLLEYRMRLATVAMVFLSLVAVIGISTLSPSYFIITIRKNILQDQLKAVESSDKASNTDGLSKKINDLATQASYLIPTADPISPAKLFLHIEDGTGADTVIKDFHMTYFDENISVDISGNSKNRDSLTKFINNLKQDPVFTGATFPYSSLAKQNNPDFSIRMLFNKTATSSVEYQ